MKNKLLLLLVLIIAFASVFAISVSAATTTEVTPETKVVLANGTSLDLYDENGEGLIWFILSTDENGVNTYASVPANRNTADNATSYVTYSINSTYGTNQMHDIYIKYWDGSSYVSYGEDKIVVANFRTFTREYWSIGSVFSGNIEYVYHSEYIRNPGTFSGNTNIKVVDASLATNITDFATQAFKGCSSLKVVRIGDSQDGYVLDGTQYGCLFQNCTSLETLYIADPSDVTSIGGSAFENCYALSMNYTFENVTVIADNAFKKSATNEGCELILRFPSIKKLGTNATDAHVFSYSGLKAIYFGDDIESMKLHIFTDCKKVEIIEFAGASEGFNFPSYTFNGCSSLKAFSIPEGMTALPGRMFLNCTSLKAVYLPSTLTAINSGSQDHSTFANCTNVYFVSQPFTFTCDDDIPAKPDVYYFPSTLKTLTGETFKNCKSLNETLVFPSGVTTISNAWAFECGINNPTLKNIVFLGNMETVTANSWKFTGNIYYANKNDLSTSDVTISGASGKHVFCNAEGNTTHLYLVVNNKPATCTQNGFIGTSCFCGMASESGTILKAEGHNKSEVISISYNGTNKFFEKGDTTYFCDKCGEQHTVNGDRKVIFKSLGISATERFTGRYSIMQGFIVNKTALADYNEISEFDIVGYGVIAGSEQKLGENSDVFDANGALINQNAATVDYMAKSQYDIFEMKISGLEKDEAYLDKAIYCCGYFLVKGNDKVESYYASEGVVTDVLSHTLTYNSLKPVSITE